MTYPKIKPATQVPKGSIKEQEPRRKKMKDWDFGIQSWELYLFLDMRNSGPHFVRNRDWRIGELSKSKQRTNFTDHST